MKLVLAILINCITVKMHSWGVQSRVWHPLHIRMTMCRCCRYSWSGYLAGVHRDRCEGGLCQGYCWPEKVPGVCSFLLVLSAVFHFQLFFGQNSFITRSITRWWKEFKFSMAPPKQKANPEKGHTSGSVVSLVYTKDSWSTKLKE